MKKHNPYRFSLGFDEQDQEHREVVRILNQLGHKKAKYVAKAVLAYSRNMEKIPLKEQATFEEETDIEQETSRIVQLQDEPPSTLQDEDILMIQKNKEFLKGMEEEI